MVRYLLVLIALHTVFFCFVRLRSFESIVFSRSSEIWGILASFFDYCYYTSYNYQSEFLQLHRQCVWRVNIKIVNRGVAFTRPYPQPLVILWNINFDPHTFVHIIISSREVKTLNNTKKLFSMLSDSKYNVSQFSMETIDVEF